MAGTLSVFSRRHEPMARMRHTSCQVGNKVLVHGGVTKHYSENTKRRLASVVEVFNLYTEVWQQKEVTGEGPAPGVYWAASASFDDGLFTFGGFDGSRRYNSLHRLKHASQWIELCPQNERAESPMAKSGAGMVAFGDNLAVFGGYGIPHGPTQPGSAFIRSARFTDGRGWTNEFHIYNLNDDVWISPDITGERPPPCAFFSLTSIDNRRAILFGGFNIEQGPMNNVYIIDLLSMRWIKLSKSGDGPWPEERSAHAACCLNYRQQHPQLLVTGGMSRRGEVLGDAWVLDVDSGRWRKVSGTVQPRRAHSICAFCVVDGVTEVTMFGGSADPPTGFDEKLSKLANTTLLQFCCSGQSEWELVSVTLFSKLGSEERVSVKKIQREERERQMEKRLQMAEERAQRAEERAQRAEKRVQSIKQQDVGTGQRVQQAEVRADELQRRLDEERHECKRLAVQLVESGRLLQQAEERAQQAEARVQQERLGRQKAEGKVLRAEEWVLRAEERVQMAEERAQQAQDREQQVREALGKRVQEAEVSADELQRGLDEVEVREKERLAVHHQAIAAEQRGPSWEVRGEGVQLTGEVIGTGGWAEVRVAHLKVAAKNLHRQLVYDYHHQLFQREMAVAARVSHPNLLRFHGAKLEGGMTILTELMPTSLRDEIEKGHHYPEHRLSWEHILSIAMDVACALNYLHHMIPDPIIHRDLSSANVLLKPTPKGGWLAKVSDYGSANFQQQLQTQNPGSPVYAAPESCNPTLQSPKMDIYSFGVLLIEMCTCEFPASHHRPQLIRSIQYPQLVELIRRCLNEDRNQRPTAAQVIDYLRALQ